MEVIPFNVFMAGSPIVSGGWTFLGMGATILVLIILEKMGFQINDKLVRIVGYTAIGYSFLLLGWKFVLFLM